MGGRPLREQTRLMILPTVIEITPRLEPVTRDTFIDRLAAVVLATDDPARSRSADRARAASR